TQTDVAVAVPRVLQLQRRRLSPRSARADGRVAGLVDDNGAWWVDAREARRPAAVQEGDVCRIDIAFEALHPVAVRDHLGGAPLVLRHLFRTEVTEDGLLVRWAHVGPDDAAGLMRRVGSDTHLALEVRFGRLRGHVDAGTGRFELPAVVD